MAVTHADLAPSRPSTNLGSKMGAFLMVLSILLGLFCFILSLIAEATRSQVTLSGKGGECTYSGSGKTPLLCASAAFLVLAIAMVIEHTYLLIVVSKSTPPPILYWDPHSQSVKTLVWQAGFFFVSTWISFAVGEILLLIGLSVESGHLRHWETPRESCLVLGQGLFSAAGVFGLLTVFLAAGLYITALRAQKFLLDQESISRQVLETSMLFASPPRSPRTIIRPVPNENPISRTSQNNIEHDNTSLAQYLSDFDKYMHLV
ncbi:uncharacterized protein LOC132032462 [Lycium ferocissimum]|uniref:uncharacterized protein LOC132032462 n=1 Tax=Lycium ferocissimum TaxID=112874 RepID=UPI002815A4DB|nr:uncharacterized protein LOC132032462 [Lycium ferocissimum]